MCYGVSFWSETQVVVCGDGGCFAFQTGHPYLPPLPSFLAYSSHPYRTAITCASLYIELGDPPPLARGTSRPSRSKDERDEDSWVHIIVFEGDSNGGGGGVNLRGSWTGIITENAWLMCDLEHLQRRFLDIAFDGETI